MSLPAKAGNPVLTFGVFSQRHGVLDARFREGFAELSIDDSLGEQIR
jgi:hypothetical protein